MIASAVTPDHPQADQAAHHLLRARARTRADQGVAFGLGASVGLFHDFAYNKCALMCRDVLDAMALLDADHPEQRTVMLRLASALGRDGNMKDASDMFMSLSRMRNDSAAPSLQELDVEALRESYSLISARFHSVVDTLYETLFSGHPEAKALFVRKPMEKQLKMLADTFTSVIDQLENTPWLEQVLSELGVRHRHYGVTDEMYDWVADALFSALRDELGEHWTPRLEEVWRTAYYNISAMMIEAARAAEDAR
jgi:hemoglobin-like flavoprotein